jgi:DNA-binding transcriptional LysR family regulator
MLTDRNVHLIEEHVDMAIRLGALPDSSITGKRLGEVRHVVCASASFLAAHGVPETPNSLVMLPCISHDFLPAPSPAWPFRKPGTKVEIMAPIRVRLAVTTAEAAVDAAIARVGVTRLISYQVAEAVARGRCRSSWHSMSRRRCQSPCFMRDREYCRSRCGASSTLRRHDYVRQWLPRG